tara:strand:- start:1523 stop:1942 length:420 start_codon:yes stop_codon:yes gene_type:complete
MNLELLKDALENDSNINIINETLGSIKSKKNDVLQQFGFTKQELKEYHNKLKNYLYIDSINELKIGHSIRYFNITDPNNIKLSINAIINDIKILDKGIAIVIKFFNNKYSTIYYNNNIIFKKLSNQENVLLAALKYLNK